MNRPTLVWHRLDLRVSDNPALSAAVERGGPVVPLYIWAPEEDSPWDPGGASRWWLHESLGLFDQSLRKLGARLVVRRGPSLDTLRTLVRETNAAAVMWNRRYEPAALVRDTKIKSELKDAGIEVQTFNSALLREPWTVRNKSGHSFKVFTPFWKHCLAAPAPERPLPAPTSLKTPAHSVQSMTIDRLELKPAIKWFTGMEKAWNPGEKAGLQKLRQFAATGYKDYSSLRNRPDLPGTSRLSPHLHFGELSPRQIWHALGPEGAPSRSQYLAEVGWREFAHHLLFHHANSPEEPLREEFGRFPWRKEESWLKAWTKGKTGYPIVDAGMRELWTTGWMHNRVRMIVASFLVKDLMISWKEGAKWFWDTLIDADLAQNTLGWQWTAGCGADAAPFFRIFNPVLQGEKFDPEGTYVSQWCPELKRLPTRWIHRPWEAPPAVLKESGVKPGTTYPEPIVSHTIAREVALEAYQKVRQGA